MSQTNWWSLVQETMQALSPLYQQETQAVFEQVGYQSGDWFNSFMAYGLEPQPLTADFYQSQFPYISLTRQQNGLAETAERGFLTAVSPHTYHLSDKGRNAITRFFSTAVAAISQVNPLPTADLERLAVLLYKVVKTILNTPEPAQKSQLLISRRTDPGMSTHPAARIDQYMTDLQRFRDDAHLAAWAHHGVSGQAWETLTFTWHEPGQTAEKLAETLSFRGHPAEGYAVALAELGQKGWLVAGENGYELSENGRLVRETAETLTDTYFQTGFSALSTAEQTECADLLTHFNHALTEMNAGGEK